MYTPSRCLSVRACQTSMGQRKRPREVQHFETSHHILGSPNMFLLFGSLWVFGGMKYQLTRYPKAISKHLHHRLDYLFVSQVSNGTKHIATFILENSNITSRNRHFLVISLQWQIIAMPGHCDILRARFIGWFWFNCYKHVPCTDHPEFLSGRSEDPSVFWAYQVLPPFWDTFYMFGGQKGPTSGDRLLVHSWETHQVEGALEPWSQPGLGHCGIPCESKPGIFDNEDGQRAAHSHSAIVSVNTLTFVCYIAKHQLWMCECWISFWGIVYFWGFLWTILPWSTWSQVQSGRWHQPLSVFRPVVFSTSWPTICHPLVW